MSLNPDTSRMSASSNTRRRRRRRGMHPATGILGALAIMTFLQAAQSDWIMAVVLLCTIGWIILQERTRP